MPRAGDVFTEDPEADITVNGVDLTEGQSMTVRVALESFASHLSTDGLGDDEHGRRMTRKYLDRIDEIRRFIFRGRSSEDFYCVDCEATFRGAEQWQRHLELRHTEKDRPKRGVR